MNVIEPTTPEGQPIFIRMRSDSRPKVARERDTAVMRSRDFITMMKIIAAHDLWDELEAQAAAQGCTNFRIGAQPMRIASAVLRHKIEQGELPIDTPGLFACSSLGGGSDGGDAAGKAGAAGGAVESAKKKPGDVLEPGDSEGSKDKPQ